MTKQRLCLTSPHRPVEASAHPMGATTYGHRPYSDPLSLTHRSVISLASNNLVRLSGFPAAARVQVEELIGRDLVVHQRSLAGRGPWSLFAQQTPLRVRAPHPTWVRSSVQGCAAEVFERQRCLAAGIPELCCKGDCTAKACLAGGQTSLKWGQKTLAPPQPLGLPEAWASPRPTDDGDTQATLLLRWRAFGLLGR
jgi:hypothetical protein